jgi:hypothetical protein
MERALRRSFELARLEKSGALLHTWKRRSNAKAPSAPLKGNSLFKLEGRQPFSQTMNVSSAGSALKAQMQVAVAKKQLESVKEQGAQSLELIQASSAPSGAQGQKLNIVA